MNSNLNTWDKLYWEEDNTSICGTGDGCDIIQDFLNETIENFERKERIQTYGLDYSIIDLLAMKDNPWETLRQLI